MVAASRAAPACSRATASTSSVTNASLIRPSPRSSLTTLSDRASALPMPIGPDDDPPPLLSQRGRRKGQRGPLLLTLLSPAAPDRQRLDHAAKRTRLLLGQPRAHEQVAQVALHQRRLIGGMKEPPVLQ